MDSKIVELETTSLAKEDSPVIITPDVKRIIHCLDEHIQSLELPFESGAKEATMYGEIKAEELLDMISHFIGRLKPDELCVDLGCGSNRFNLIINCLTENPTLGIENIDTRFACAVKIKKELLKTERYDFAGRATLWEKDIRDLEDLNGAHMVYSFNACMGDELRGIIRKLVEDSTTVKVYISNDPVCPSGYTRYKKAFLLDLTSKEKDSRMFYVYLSDKKSDDVMFDLRDSVPSLTLVKGKRLRSGRRV